MCKNANSPRNRTFRKKRRFYNLQAKRERGALKACFSVTRRRRYIAPYYTHISALETEVMLPYIWNFQLFFSPSKKYKNTKMAKSVLLPLFSPPFLLASSFIAWALQPFAFPTPLSSSSFPSASFLFSLLLLRCLQALPLLLLSLSSILPFSLAFKSGAPTGRLQAKPSLMQRGGGRGRRF